ncbi:hypothetical protein AURDEDRAFT_166383 [Auricularia subglabra TFB-10046 SS5]|uniref:Uncharacterized protein n=1 Tax=Auricularia subglabra (strain TFB-10046 / SS5) TaxID=717982 RepID=J0LKQ6_AURST|nr:hypothetical protein AURDEDRAFT_166383 [Auricularia subglabra TFB-10046 SS5]
MSSTSNGEYARIYGWERNSKPRFVSCPRSPTSFAQWKTDLMRAGTQHQVAITAAGARLAHGRGTSVEADGHGRTAKPCFIETVPYDVWLLILHAEWTNYGRLRLIRAFGATCTHARAMTLKYAFPEVWVSGHKGFLLYLHRAGLPGSQAIVRDPSAFDYTRTVQVLHTHKHLCPFIELARVGFPRLSFLALHLQAVYVATADAAWTTFAGDLACLCVLKELPHLTRLRIGLFVWHDYEEKSVNLSGLKSLAGCTQLEDLGVRIGGGLRFVAVDLSLPPSVRKLLLSVQAFSAYSPSSWSSCPPWLEIEEERQRAQLRRRYQLDAARELTACLPPSGTTGFLGLRTLRLLGVYLDLEGVHLISELSEVTRLDLHPRSVELLPNEKDFLRQKAVSSSSGMGSLAHLFNTTGIGPVTGYVSMLSGDEAASLLETIIYLVSHMENLRVLHVGGRADDPRILGMAPAGAQALYLDLVPLIAPYIPRGLSLLHFGQRHADSMGVYIHLPTCGMCATTPGRKRSAECIGMEHELMETAENRDYYALAHAGPAAHDLPRLV